MVGAFGTYGRQERYKIDKVWRPDGKRPLGKPKRQWVDNTKIDLQDTGWVGMG